MARTVLDSQLQLLDAQLLVMASSTEDALRTSIAALAARDAEAANAVIDGDDDIDHQEREIEGLCVKLLLTQQPVATDLHRVSAALKIAGDLERIGDQATDIAEIALTLQGELDGELSAHLREMGDRACSILHDATEAFVERDAERARATIGEDAQIDALFESVKSDVVRGVQDEGSVASNLVEALMLAKYLERVGDHAQNIAEWVEYALTGRYKGELLG